MSTVQELIDALELRWEPLSLTMMLNREKGYPKLYVETPTLGNLYQVVEFLMDLHGAGRFNLSTSMFRWAPTGDKYVHSVKITIQRGANQISLEVCASRPYDALLRALIDLLESDEYNRMKPVRKQRPLTTDT